MKTTIYNIPYPAGLGKKTIPAMENPSLLFDFLQQYLQIVKSSIFKFLKTLTFAFLQTTFDKLTVVPPMY